MNRNDLHKNWTLFAACLGTFMLLIDVTIVIVALPSIRGSLHTSFSDVQWTIDAYSLTLAALLLMMGSLGDILGRRRVFAFGLAIFTLGSLLCGASQSGLMLIACRAFQGIGGAIIFPTALALLAQTFEGRERGFAFGVWGAVSAAASGIGPLIGGLLTSDLSWRWIFYVNLPVGALAILVTLTRVREFRPAYARRIDLPGVIVFTTGLFALVYALIESSRHSWQSTMVLGSLVVALVLLGSFPLLEHRRKEPMFDLTLFRKPTFLGGSIAAFGMNASLYAMFLYLTLYLQNVQHLSPLGAGLRLAIVTFAATITALPAGRASQRISARWLIGPGLLLVGSGLLLMRGITPDSGWTHLLPGFLIAGLGSGMVNAPLASTAVGVVEPKHTGMASGISATCRQVGIATAIAALGSIFAHGLSGSAGTAIAIHYASTLNELLLIGAITAFTAGALSLSLIRRRDFLSPGTQAASSMRTGSPRPAAT